MLYSSKCTVSIIKFASLYILLYPNSTLTLNQYFKNVDLQHYKYCSNIDKCRFNVEEMLRKRLMSVKLQCL